MTNLEAWNAMAFGMTFVAAVLFYLWTAIALSAVFRKSGEAGWKAWVPIWNAVVVLRLGGLSGWLVLLFLIPFVGWALLVFAAYRINVAFGHGAGMTVLAAVLFPLWATVLGFGTARWLGRETGIPRGPVRTSAVDVPPPPANLRPSAYTPATGAPPLPPPPSLAWPLAPPPLPGSAAAAAAPASPAASVAPAPPVPPAPVPPAPGPARVGAVTTAPATAAADDLPSPARAAGGYDTAAPASLSTAYDAPSPARARSGFASPAARSSWDADEPSSAASSDAGPAPSFPRRTGAVAAPVWELDSADGSEHSWDFDFGAAGVTSEVTDAVTGAPAPVSAAPVPARSADDPPAAPDEPPVTRVPNAPTPAALREPWAPAQSPMPSEGEAFPETSGPVSAIVGAPSAGTPRSALTSVSAMHTRPHIPEEEELEQTVVARRKRTPWTLIGPDGARIPLTGDTVILGRRPSPDPAHPDAQLVPLDDDTRTVSKTHALLELREDHWFITDLDSTNGVLFTTLLGTEVAATPGEPTEAGERFLLGDAEVSLSRSDA
jgi:hypothetical protein